MLGISVYPDKSTVEECKIYINKAVKLGYKRLFTSSLELQPTNITQTITSLKKVLQHAKAKKMWISLDINPQLFKLLNIDYNNLSFFKDLGADILRLDMNFDGLSESIMTHDPSGLLLEVNISNDTGNIANILSYSPLKNKILGCHNFYPQPFTGLDTSYFLSTTTKYKQMGLRTAAFVSSKTAKIGPHAYNDGLPTLEIHRHHNLVEQVQYLINIKLIDDIIIGNAFASDKELEDIAKLNLDLAQFFVTFLPSTTNIEKEIILDNLHFNRGDINSYSIRSTFVKFKYANSEIPINNALYKLEKGDVTLGNNSFGQYKGEVNIVKQCMPNIDKHKNVVAKVISNNISFIDFIEPWDKFKFIDATTY